MTELCIICGESFERPRGSSARTCSRSCRAALTWHTAPKRKTGPTPKPRVIADCEWCGEPVKWAQRPGRQGKFCSRTCAGRAKSKGGLSFKDGRWFVRLRDGGWQIYARCLMEGHLGRDLSSDEHVHHVNEDKTDDRIENLAIVTPAEHIALHREGMTAGLRSKAKLSPTEVAYIKASTEPTSDLARRLNVTDGAITYHRGALLKSYERDA